MRLFGCYWLLFFFPFFPLCPANPVTSPEVAEVVIPAKGTGAHRAFCPQSARLGPGTNGSFPLLLLRRHHQGGVWPWKLVREMHNVKEDLQSEMLEGRWEKGRNGQGQIWGLRAREQHSLMGPGEPQRLEVPDLNKEVFSLVRQAWVSLGCLVEQGACQGMETFLETPLGPSLPLVLPQLCQARWKFVFPTRSATALSICWVCLEHGGTEKVWAEHQLCSCSCSETELRGDANSQECRGSLSAAGGSACTAGSGGLGWFSDKAVRLDGCAREERRNSVCAAHDSSFLLQEWLWAQ